MCKRSIGFHSSPTHYSLKLSRLEQWPRVPRCHGFQYCLVTFLHHYFCFALPLLRPSSPLSLTLFSSTPHCREHLDSLQGVAWRKLGECLIGDSEYNLESSQWSYPLDEIEEHKSDDSRLRAVIERWLQGEGLDEEPSWRRIIWRLDDATETSAAAETIRCFAEPLPGKSCDCITLLYSTLVLGHIR